MLLVMFVSFHFGVRLIRVLRVLDFVDWFALFLSVLCWFSSHVIGCSVPVCFFVYWFLRSS